MVKYYKFIFNLLIIMECNQLLYSLKPQTPLSSNVEKLSTPSTVLENLSSNKQPTHDRVSKVVSDRLTNQQELYNDLYGPINPRQIQLLQIFFTHSELKLPQGQHLFKIKKHFGCPETMFENPHNFIVKSNKCFLTTNGKKIRRAIVYDKKNPTLGYRFIWKSITNPCPITYKQQQTEKAIIHILQKRNVTLLTNFLSFNNKKITTLQSCFGKDLLSLLEERTLSPAHLLEIGLQLIEKLSILHQEAIAHADLKLENILVKMGLKIDLRLIDFEYSRIKNCVGPNEGFCTLERAAPEYFYADQIDYIKADMWALGLILYYLFNQELAYLETYLEISNYVRTNDTIKINPTLWKQWKQTFYSPCNVKVSPSFDHSDFITQLQSILNKTLAYHPSDRASIHEIKEMYILLMKTFNNGLI